MNTAAFFAEVSLHTDPVIRYKDCKAMAKGFANSIPCEKQRLEKARKFCTALVDSYWQSLCQQHETELEIKKSPSDLNDICSEVLSVAQQTGHLIAQFPVEDAGFLIGSIYTVMLPSTLRSKLGAYYTPPALVSRLLDIAEKGGVNFATDSVIDPACGGGAFLAPTALRMLKKMPKASAEWTLNKISSQLKGIEIDPFAAWMTSVLLEAALMPLCVQANRRLPDLILVGDTLEHFKNVGTFDLVIGNPPYGRLTLSPEQRKCFSRSLYGHANLYGVFTDLALRLVKDKGVIAYLTPTSFLGGRYFKSLRKLLLEESTPVFIDFISDRNEVFDGVLQETLLTVYRKEITKKSASLSLITPNGLYAAKVDLIGKIKLPRTGAPWVLPRTPNDMRFISALYKMPTRLLDLGFTVSTGQLVWNRHKTQLRDSKGTNALPLIWAESVTANQFNFRAERKNHVPYIEVEENQSHLITQKPCVLLQRTTAKEQKRRLVNAVLPQSFLDSHQRVVIENHLNIISADNSKEQVISVNTISILLNTETVDRAFRGISGSVAVSAYELNALPLPSLEQVIELESFISQENRQEAIESLVASFYGENK